MSKNDIMCNFEMPISVPHQLAVTGLPRGLLAGPPLPGLFAIVVTQPAPFLAATPDNQTKAAEKHHVILRSHGYIESKRIIENLDLCSRNNYWLAEFFSLGTYMLFFAIRLVPHNAARARNISATSEGAEASGG